MSYHRSMGQPITSPSEVEDPVVSPTRVDCADLPSDSPWRQPGQVCADSGQSSGGPLDFINDLIQQAMHPTSSSPSSATSESVGAGTWLLLGAAALGTYWLLSRKKRKP